MRCRQYCLTNSDSSGSGSASGSGAVEHELERDLLDDYLRELDDKYGLVPENLVEHYDALWPS